MMHERNGALFALCIVFLLAFAGLGVHARSTLHENVRARMSSASASSVGSTRVGGGVNGGTECIACTVIIGLVEQLTIVYNISVETSLDRLCSFLPNPIRTGCERLVDEFGVTIIEMLEAKETPDSVCHGIHICRQDTPDVCHLFPVPKSMTKPEYAAHLAAQQQRRPNALHKKSICDMPEFEAICKIFGRVGDHKPVEDLDQDLYSSLPTLRGSSWRGKDCDDLSKNVHPGRRPLDNDREFDSNCNGIFGVDPGTGKSYEELYCSDADNRGVVVLGDSVGAHFHIPVEWFTASELSVEVFRDLIFILENELDWPMLSSATAYMNSTWSVTPGPVDSSYLRYRAKNRCNHRDFQNVAVDGARSGAMNDSIVRSLARTPDDYPVYIFFELVGNDVCNGHYGIDHMTTPQEFFRNNLATFQYLDSTLPPGSVVVATGLVDGRVLYDNLHDRIHPVGSTRKDVTYSMFYDYLNCMQTSPCFGWMNTNETWRNATTERAMELNAALADLVQNQTFTNFKAYYVDNPLADVIAYWDSLGHETYELVEPVDGFHPNQVANALTTSILWKKFESDFPELIPKENPNNADIEARFGDQGGY